MDSHMKTTIELPDELFIAAKKRAAELREPLRALVERGLRAELGRGKGRSAAKRRAVLLGPGPSFAIRLLQIAADLDVTGPRVFDLQIALCALDGGAGGCGRMTAGS